MVKSHKREGGYMVGQECNTAVQMPHANVVSRLLYLPRGISRLEKLGQRKVFPKNHMLLQGIAHDPQLSMDIMESLSTKFLSAMEQVRHTNFHNAGWKICDLLLIFAEHYGVPYDGKILIKEKISQQLLSNLLGINRVTAVRAIKELKEMALIEQINGYYCIRSLEKLKRHQERMCQ